MRSYFFRLCNACKHHFVLVQYLIDKECLRRVSVENETHSIKKYVYIYVAKMTKKFVKEYTLYFYVSVQESLSLSFSMFSRTYDHNMPCRQWHRVRISLFRVRVDFCVVGDATSIIYTKGYLIKMYMYGII